MAPGKPRRLLTAHAAVARPSAAAAQQRRQDCVVEPGEVATAPVVAAGKCKPRQVSVRVPLPRHWTDRCILFRSYCLWVSRGCSVWLDETQRLLAHRQQHLEPTVAQLGDRCRLPRGDVETTSRERLRVQQGEIARAEREDEDVIRTAIHVLGGPNSASAPQRPSLCLSAEHAYNQ